MVAGISTASEEGCDAAIDALINTLKSGRHAPSLKEDAESTKLHLKTKGGLPFAVDLKRLAQGDETAVTLSAPARMLTEDERNAMRKAFTVALHPDSVGASKTTAEDLLRKFSEAIGADKTKRTARQEPEPTKPPAGGIPPVAAMRATVAKANWNLNDIELTIRLGEVLQATAQAYDIYNLELPADLRQIILAGHIYSELKFKQGRSTRRPHAQDFITAVLSLGCTPARWGAPGKDGKKSLVKSSEYFDNFDFARVTAEFLEARIDWIIDPPDGKRPAEGDRYLTEFLSQIETYDSQGYFKNVAQKIRAGLGMPSSSSHLETTN